MRFAYASYCRSVPAFFSAHPVRFGRFLLTGGDPPERVDIISGCA